MTNKQLMICLAQLAILLTGIAVCETVVAQTDEPRIRQEYFVQQDTDESLLIRINAFEAEFETKISGQGGVVLSHSGIHGSRLAPVFQYIHIPKEPRQLDIEVTSNLSTRRTEFGLELSRLKVWDDRSNSLSHAYQLLSFGMEVTASDTSANWSVKIDSLLNAGKQFGQFGMQELRLWSNYLAAHLIHFQLHDHSFVYSLTREMLAELNGSRFQKIELATLQLQSAALIGLRMAGTLPVSASNPNPVQAVLSRAASLAEAMGFHFEQASALNASAQEYAARSNYTRALEQFQLAVEIADTVGDAELAKGIRESIVQIHATQGNAPASSEVLQEIESQLVEEGAGDELALNLLAQGRLLIESYRYPQAIKTLTQALNYENNSAIRRQINVELARASYENGRLDDSMAFLQEAGISADTSGQMRPNSVLDIGDALQVMAGIHRSLGQFTAMRKARGAQAQFRPGQAHYYYQQALDELAVGRNNRGRALSLFRQAQQAASASGHNDLQHLSRLHICVLADPGDKLCNKTGLKNSYEALRNGTVPRRAVEAMYLQARILVLNGQRTRAIELMGRLVDEIHFLRHSLPGVLGSWYGEWHERLFEYYLELSLKTPEKGGKGRTKDLESLLALSKIRYIERQASSETAADTSFENTELLRIQLARREHLPSGKASPDLERQILQGMDAMRTPFAEKFEFLSKTGLQRYLRSLSDQEAVLTYHLNPAMVRVWVGRKGQVQQRVIANPGKIYAAIEEARNSLADISVSSFERRMSTLGRLLVDPVYNLLPETVYWIPAGPLLGFPLDAARAGGRFLLEKHTVINLSSFPANVNPASRLQLEPGDGSPKRMFLAGHPTEYSENYATRLDTSEAIRAVADIFVGPGLRIVQGRALLPDEFQDPRFLQADLVHLTMPGTINLAYPERSSLDLSGDEYSPQSTSFSPRDLQDKELNAGLVFLCDTRTRGTPHSGFSNQMGLVNGFIDAGAGAVIASLWANPCKTGDAFVTDFYQRLQRTGDIAGSLVEARRKFLQVNSKSGLFDWAAFQIFVD